MQLGSPNLTCKCSTMRTGQPFILGLKDQRSRLQCLCLSSVKMQYCHWCCIHKLHLFFPAVVHCCTSNVSNTGFSVHYFPWSACHMTLVFPGVGLCTLVSADLLYYLLLRARLNCSGLYCPTVVMNGAIGWYVKTPVLALCTAIGSEQQKRWVSLCDSTRSHFWCRPLMTSCDTVVTSAAAFRCQHHLPQHYQQQLRAHCQQNVAGTYQQCWTENCSRRGSVVHIVSK